MHPIPKPRDMFGELCNSLGLEHERTPAKTLHQHLVPEGDIIIVQGKAFNQILTKGIYFDKMNIVHIEGGEV